MAGRSRDLVELYSIERWEGFTILGKCEETTSLDRQPVHLRSSFLVDVQVGEQGDPAFDHGEGLGNDDGAPS